MAYARHFMDSVLVENMLQTPIPNPLKRTEEEIRYLRRIEARAHLTSYDPATHQESLNSKEEEANFQYQRAKLLVNAPRWGGIDFKFAAKGEPGSIWELPLDVASFLVNQFRKAGTPLRVLEAEEVSKVEPRWRPLPTDAQLANKGFNSEMDLEPIDGGRKIGLSTVAANLTAQGLTERAVSGVTASNVE